jgi:ribonuclease HII
MTLKHRSQPKARDVRTTMGIDEAGRGPAIGPLVMAAVIVDSRAAAALTRAGLTDSKAFGAGASAHQQRLQLADLVRSKAVWYKVSVVPAATVDARVWCGELNALERDVATELIAAAPSCSRIIADGARMFAPMTATHANFEARDRAETFHAAVAAASVLAKTARDDHYANFCRQFNAEFGEIRGAGYVNDATRTFLCAYAKKYQSLPDEVRLSWPHPYVAKLVDLPKLIKARQNELPESVTPKQLTLF